MCSTFRLMAGNDGLTEKSAKILLDRGLVQVDGGKYSFFFFSNVFVPHNNEGVTEFSVNRVHILQRHASSLGTLRLSFVILSLLLPTTICFVHFQKNIVRISLEESLDFQSRIKASVLVIM